MKTVGDLKKALEAFADDMPVVLYLAMNEDMENYKTVRIESKDDEDNMSYCKGDHILDYKKDIRSVVVVSS